MPLGVASMHTTGRETSNAIPRLLSFKYHDPAAIPMPASKAPWPNKEIFRATVFGIDFPALS